MKFFSAILVILFSVPAFAAQTVNCRELNRDGSLKAGGGKVRVQLEYNANGKLSTARSKVKATGWTREGSDLLDNMRVITVSNGIAINGAHYSTFFFDDQIGELDIQLQFNRHVMKQSFSNYPANFVISSDDANPETGFAFGYPVTCNSRY